MILTINALKNAKALGSERKCHSSSKPPYWFACNDEEELVQDIMMLMAVFSGKLYGHRSAKRRKEKKLQKEIDKSIGHDTIREKGDNK